MSIADKITQLTTIRGDIRTALAGKGVSASDHDYADFADDIDSISGGGGGTDGQFFPVNMALYIPSKITLTYEGDEI